MIRQSGEVGNLAYLLYRDYDTTVRRGWKPRLPTLSGFGNPSYKMAISSWGVPLRESESTVFMPYGMNRV